MTIAENIAQGLRLLANGVYVVAAAEGDQTHGCTATWVSQASFRNPLLTVALDKRHDTYNLIERTGKLVINVLGADQAEVAEHFGHKRAQARSQYFREENGRQQPVLKEGLAAIFAQVVDKVDARDHVVLLVEATDSLVFGTGAPLVYSFDGGYGVAKSSKA
ncbi:MAG: flavin reductase family protein [Chloroflexota bacterium]